MVWTTPVERKDEHKKWHSDWLRGGCGYCGYYCNDCPVGVATCKCVVEDLNETTKPVHET